MAKSDFSYLNPLRVRWAEADLQGVVFNANYLLYMDVAVTEYWRHITSNKPETIRQDIERLYVVRSTIDFHQSARYDDLLEIGVRALRLGNSSMLFQFEIYRDDDHLITGQLTYVHAIDGKSATLPTTFTQLILQHEKTAPEMGKPRP
jgi:acyl-CoA thioester hydrolase